MGEFFRLEHFAEIFRQHPLSVFFLLLTLLTILLAIVLRWWIRRRLRLMLEEKFEEGGDLDEFPSLSPRDQEALELIKEYRASIWDLPEGELQLNFESLNQRGVEIVRSIAAVYHPQAEIPQYEASLVELLNMARRVSTRLIRLSSGVPFKYLGDRRLSDYQRYYQVYRKINENPVLGFFKRNPHLYKAAKLAMNMKNLANPLYWAGKELSREGFFYLIRWFHMTYISQVGKEAMRVFSGRGFHTEEERDATLGCYQLFALTRQWGGPSAAEWAAFIDFLSGHSSLDPEMKLQILSACSRDRLPKDLDQQVIGSKSGIKLYRQGLKRIQNADSTPSPIKTRLIESELSPLQSLAEKEPE
jgi:hypothetical protein